MQPQVVGHVQGTTRASRGSRALHGAGKAAPERQPQQHSFLAGGPVAEAALAAAASMAQPYVDPSPPSHVMGPRTSSQPKLLAHPGHSPQPHQLTSAGSGAAPVSPHPAAPPPVLRRASSTCAAGQHSAASTHSSSAADDAGPAADAGKGGVASRDGSRRDGSCGTAAGPAAGADASLASWWGAAEARQQVTSSGAAGEVDPRSTSSPQAMRWHPAMGPLPPEQATPAWVRKAAQQPSVPGTLAPTTTVLPPPPRVAASTEPPAEDGSPPSPLSREGPAPGSSVGTVSMLTYMLKGPSAASSAAASRESSVRSGIKRCAAAGRTLVMLALRCCATLCGTLAAAGASPGRAALPYPLHLEILLVHRSQAHAPCAPTLLRLARCAGSLAASLWRYLARTPPAEAPPATPQCAASVSGRCGRAATAARRRGTAAAAACRFAVPAAGRRVRCSRSGAPPPLAARRAASSSSMRSSWALRCSRRSSTGLEPAAAAATGWAWPPFPSW